MRTAVKVVLGGLLLLLMVVGGVAIYLSRLDPNVYKELIVEQVRRATGRELRIEGELGLSLLPIPSINATAVSFANADWGSRADMVRARTVKAQLDLVPLLSGFFDIQRLVLIEPDWLLETNVRGEGNWRLSKTATPPAPTAAEPLSETASQEREKELQFAITRVRVIRGRFTYRDGRTGHTTEVLADRALLESDLGGGPLRGSIEARYERTPVHLRGRFGELGNLILNRPVDVDLEGNIAGADVTLRGHIKEPHGFRGADVRVTASTRATAPIADRLDLHIAEMGPMNVEARLVSIDGRVDARSFSLTARPHGTELAVHGSIEGISPRPKIDVQRLSARRGDTEVTGRAAVSFERERPRIEASLDARRLDVDEIRSDLFPAKPGSGAKSESAAPVDRRVFPSNPLPFDLLSGADVELDLAADTLAVGGLSMSDVRLNATLEDGRLHATPSATVFGGRFEGSLLVEGRLEPPAVQASLSSERFAFEELSALPRDGVPLVEGASARLDLSAQGVGGSIAELMSKLEGHLVVHVQNGRLGTQVLDRAGADVMTQVFKAAIPGDKKQTDTELTCGVIRFESTDGLAVADQTLALETKQVKLIGSGVVDLRSEQLDLQGKLAALQGVRIGAGALARFVRISGTLGDPRLGTDAKALATTAAAVGGQVAGAVATAGVSLVAQGLYDYATDDPAPCHTALVREIQPRSRQTTVVDTTRATVEAPIKDAVQAPGTIFREAPKRLLRDLRGGLQRLRRSDESGRSEESDGPG